MWYPLLTRLRLLAYGAFHLLFRSFRGPCIELTHSERNDFLIAGARVSCILPPFVYSIDLHTDCLSDTTGAG
jgi:hypothetical protein